MQNLDSTPVEQRQTDRLALAISAATVMVAVAVIAVGWLVMWNAQRALTPHWTPSPPPAQVNATSFARGKKLFVTCVVCHGQDGRGMPKLGKDLTGSYLVSSLSDSELVAFIRKGRDATDPANTTKIPMPASGGNPALSDENMADLVTYLRGLQDPRRIPAVLPEVAVTIPLPAGATEAPKGATAEETEWIASGMKLFNTTCITCHGPAGVGVKGNGKALAKNEFVSGQSDESLLAFIKRGRDPGDPKNTTGVAMPPKGGNPALSDDDLLDVITYLRALQNKPAPKASANTN